MTSRPRRSGTWGERRCSWWPPSMGQAAPPEHGPPAYLNLAGNLVPGWALALLALTLLLPAALASLDALGQAVRRGARVGSALVWSASRSLPLLAALLLLYLLAVTGIVARPAFPFDPSRFRVGAGQIVAMALLATVVAAGYYWIRGWRVPDGAAARAGRPGARPGLGARRPASPGSRIRTWRCCSSRRRTSGCSTPAARALSPGRWRWARSRSRCCPWRRPSSRSPKAGPGPGAPWHLLLMVGDGQIGFSEMLALCLFGGIPGGAGGARRSWRRPGRISDRARWRG